ncbi:MAG: type I 3-dehydroquinate dehydratase [Thermodesulfovibrionales bacterium]
MIRGKLKGHPIFSKRPLIAGVVTEVAALQKGLVESADILELRIDMFNLTEEENIEEIINRARAFDKPLIATIRSEKEGGKRFIDDNTRYRIFKSIIPLVDIIDIELSSEGLFERLKPLIEKENRVLIGSYHNFNETPEDSVIEEIFLRAKEKGTGIVKIAVTANNREDLIRMASFTIRHRNDNIITISMGEHGKPSRLLFPVLGSMITYAGLTDSSAPGQFSVDEMARYFKAFGL